MVYKSLRGRKDRDFRDEPGAHRFLWPSSDDLPQNGASRLWLSILHRTTALQIKEVQGGQVRTTLSPTEADSPGGFCAQPRVFDHVMQELLRGATKVSAHPARAVCFLWLS